MVRLGCYQVMNKCHTVRDRLMSALADGQLSFTKAGLSYCEFDIRSFMRTRATAVLAGILRFRGALDRWQQRRSVRGHPNCSKREIQTAGEVIGDRGLRIADAIGPRLSETAAVTNLPCRLAPVQFCALAANIDTLLTNGPTCTPDS